MNKKIIIFIILLFACLQRAQAIELRCSEIMYDVIGADNSHEWLELINIGSEDIVATSTWRFFDGSNHLINWPTATTTVASGEIFILADNREQFLLDYPDFSGLVVDTVMSLPNTSSTLALSFDQGESYTTEIHYDSAWGGSDGFSLAKVGEAWQSSCGLGGSPGTLNPQCDPEEPLEEEDEPEILDDTHWAKLIISEFMPNPEGSDDSEWIELFNSGEETIDLTGFSLGDNSSRLFYLDTDCGLDLSLPAGGYLLVEKSISGISLNNSSGDSVNLYNPQGVLQEKVEYREPAYEGRSYARTDSGFVWTKTPTPGTVNQIVENQPPIASISVEGSFYVGQKIVFSGENSSDPEGGDLDYSWQFGDGEMSSKKTIQHKFAQAGNFTVVLTVTDSEDASDRAEFEINIYPESLADQVEEKEGTNEEEKIVREINFAEDDLIISEFLPNPEGSDDSEWIELFNQSDKELDLNGFMIDDQEGGSKPYQFSSTTILANSFLLVKRQDSKISLNNSGDSVRLLRPDGSVWQEVLYEKVPEGKTWAWDFENLEWSVFAPSPLAPNIKIEIPETIYPIAEIKSLEKNSHVLIEGMVINRPDKDSRSIYLADFDSIYVNFDQLTEVYSYYKDFPELVPGEVVIVSGEISRLGDLPRIKIKSSEDISKTEQKIDFEKPEAVSPDDIDSDFLGGFVTVRGMVVKKSGKSIYLASDPEEEPALRIYTKFSTQELEIKKGSEVIASGILSETDSGFKLEPFSIEDIRVSQEVLGEKVFSDNQSIEIVSSSQMVLDNEGNQASKNILIFIVVALLISGVIYFIQNKKRPRAGIEI